MYSFLNDRELYGTPLAEQPPAPGPQRAPVGPSGGAPVAVQAAHHSAQAPPPPPPDIFLKSAALLEQRVLSLEERLVVALAKFSTEMAAAAAAKRPCEGAATNFWTFVLAVALASGLVLLVAWMFRPRWPGPSPQQAAAIPQLLVQSLPAQAAAVPLLQAGAPPTPVIFAAPPTFLQGA